MRLPDESVEDFLAHHCHEEQFDCDLLEAIADANRRWGAQTGLGHAEIIENWLGLTPIERAAALPESAKGRADGEGHAAHLGGPVEGRAPL